MTTEEKFKMNQKGIIPLYILIGVLIIGSLGGLVYLKQISNKAPVGMADDTSQIASSSAIPSSTALPDKQKSVSQKKSNPTAPTPSPSPKSSISPTPSPTSTPIPTPIPTPKPKPTCSVTVLPPSSGNAPFEASVCVGNNSNPYQAIQQEFVDYDGNGTWDYQGAQYGCHSYIFQNPGNYSPKAKIIGSSSEESEICQASVTVN